MENLKKCALITGATSGIGYELAKLFAADNYNLVLVARNNTELTEAATELKNFNVDVTTIEKDLFEKDSAKEIYDEVTEKGIEINVLVNNAGQGHYGLFADTELERELDIVQLNINAVITLTKYFANDMVVKGGGKILNLGSIAGESPGPWNSVYHGTKAFINSWSAAIQNELKAHQISVTCLLPGATDTDFFNKAGMQQSKIVQEDDLGDVQKVAKDGYEALMAGEAKVISGLKNKINVGMSNIVSDESAARQMENAQKPV